MGETDTRPAGSRIPGDHVTTARIRPFQQTWKGYDYDTLAKDLGTLMTTLNLNDAVLVGFSMGGGEVARYLGTVGSQRVSGAVFVSAVPPFLLNTADNPDGVDGSVFEGIMQGIIADRPAFLTAFFNNFYNVDIFRSKLISEEAIR